MKYLCCCDGNDITLSYLTHTTSQSFVTLSVCPAFCGMPTRNRLTECAFGPNLYAKLTNCCNINIWPRIYEVTVGGCVGEVRDHHVSRFVTLRLCEWQSLPVRNFQLRTEDRYVKKTATCAPHGARTPTRPTRPLRPTRPNLLNRVPFVDWHVQNMV